MSATEPPAEEEQARKVRQDRLTDLADPDCERCEGSGLDPDKFMTSKNADGQAVYHLTEPCQDCIDNDDDLDANPTCRKCGRDASDSHLSESNMCDECPACRRCTLVHEDVSV